MAEESYRDYLAARVLTENKPVTYRLLSRALKVDVNSAKRMLYEFHSTQNAKKPNSIHATYLVAGRQRKPEHTNGVNARNGDDVDMRSSPFMSSMPEPEEEEPEEEVKETTILLVREEELQNTRAEFEEETSIHVYSLEPGPLENLDILATCNHETVTNYTDVDPLERWKFYGAIQNPHIKRRTGKGVPPAAAATSKSAAKPATKPAAKAAVTTQPKKDVPALVRQGSAVEDKTSARSTPQPPSTLKRSDSKSGAKKSQTAGDLFKSFAKSKPKSKEAEKSKESTPAPEDETMGGMSEDEGDAEDAPEVVVDEAKNEAARKAREDRQEKLRKMMEDDDEDMLDAPVEAESQSEKSPAADADSPDPSQGEATVKVENGRRRGKRRVMKKKKVKDEDGYLVTKEEAVWESFSEDEPQPKAKPAPPKPSSSAKGKPAGKKGQGSIASFFKKA